MVFIIIYSCQILHPDSSPFVERALKKTAKAVRWREQHEDFRSPDNIEIKTGPSPISVEPVDRAMGGPLDLRSGYRYGTGYHQLIHLVRTQAGRNSRSRLGMFHLPGCLFQCLPRHHRLMATLHTAQGDVRAGPDDYPGVTAAWVRLFKGNPVTGLIGIERKGRWHGAKPSCRQ